MATAPFRHRVTVRYGETDQMGVAHHANFLLYLEDARTAYMKDRVMPYGELERRGVGLPVRTVNVRYRQPARYEDELDVAVWVEGARAASLTFGYRITRAEADGSASTLATASVELACVDLSSMRPRAFPDELVGFIEAERRTDGG